MSEPRQSEDDASVWVVGVDGSATARHAAMWAVRHGRGRASALRLVAAWSIPSAPALPPIGPMRKYWDVESFERDAHTALARLAAEFRSTAAIPVETRLAEGPSSAVLLDSSRDADLLIVGARGLGGFHRLVVGSTSTQCAAHAHVPTVVVPEEVPIEDSARIVVAIDGSETSRRALHWALDFAAPESSIECVNVWEVWPTASVPAPPPESVEEAAERFEQLVDGVRNAAQLPHDDSLTVTCRLEQGDPRSILGAAGTEGDLLVVGAHGGGGVSAALLGSVSSWLLHHVPRPIVVIPPANATRG